MLSLEELGLRAQTYSSDCIHLEPNKGDNKLDGEVANITSKSTGSAVLGRVATVERGQQHLVLTANGSQWSKTSGRLAAVGPEIAVGDWVVLRSEGLTMKVLPRRTYLARRAVGRQSQPQVVAANLDWVFVVTAVGEDFSPRRLERYITLINEGGAKPVIVLNKTDLPFNIAHVMRDINAVAPGVPLCMISGQNRQLDELQPFLQPRQTIALVGSSGVGKSTIINGLLGSYQQSTSNVRSQDHKGRHTTTRRELFVVPSSDPKYPNRGLIIDTPGMREVGLTAATDGLAVAFHDVTLLAEGCRFRDCTHSEEPGCAVKAAREQGKLAEDRWKSHQSLQKEVAYEARRADPRAHRDTKSRWKSIHKELKIRRKIDPKLRGR
ncbi:MAG: ribosome small subunit-dependent GTPase A [Myxococcales bacterium]|nr:ribosome small subunit-dependent GTPase A [Myxococcales bacterium]